MLRRPPRRRLAHLFVAGGGIARQIDQEVQEPTPRADVELVGKVEVVEALKVGLYGCAVVGEELVEADEFPVVTF